MARLLSNGFELGTTTNGVEWTMTFGTPSVTSATVLSGSFAGQTGAFVSVTREGFLTKMSSAATSMALYLRVNAQFASFPTLEDRFAAMVAAPSNNAAAAAYWTIDNNRQARCYTDAGVLGSPTASLNANQWYRFELHYDNSLGAGSAAGDGLLDGSVVGSAGNLTITNPVQAIMVGGNLNAEANTAGSFFFDDIALNDGTGTTQNSFPGVSRIMHLWPNAPGTAAAFNRVAGPGSINWQFVGTTLDKPTPDDATSFLAATVAQTVDDWKLEATPASIGASDTINFVAVNFRLAGGFTGNNTIIRARVFASVSGPNIESATFQPANASWNTNGVGVAAALTMVPLVTTNVIPGVASSTMWTKASLDNALIGARINTAGASGAAQVSAAWLTVDWTTFVAPSPGLGLQLGLLTGVGR